jgi:hypothetical protein
MIIGRHHYCIFAYYYSTCTIELDLVHVSCRHSTFDGPSLICDKSMGIIPGSRPRDLELVGDAVRANRHHVPSPIPLALRDPYA